MKPYSSYKKSGVEWIGEIPRHWELLKVKNICSFSKGQGLSKTLLDNDGKNECILYGELFTTYKNFNVIHNVVSRTNEDGSVFSTGNEILIPGSTTTTGIDLSNSKYLPQSDIILGGDIIILNPRSTYVREFISLHLTFVSTPEFIVGSRGVTIYHIYPKQIREMYISHPPLPEQKQIVSFLDHKTQKIDKLIEKTEQKIELLKEKRTSIINHCVTKGLNPNVEMKDSRVEWIGKIPKHWDVCLLKYKTLNITDGAHVSPETDNGVYPFVSTVDLDEGTIDFENCLLTSDENYRLLQRQGCNPEPGDVLFSKDGTIGKTVLITKQINFIVASSLIIIKPEVQKIFPKYMDYLLQSHFVLEQINSFVKGAALRRLSIKNLKRIIGVFPPIDEQVLIVEHLKKEIIKINTLRSEALEKIALLNEYRTSLISEVVTGKIDVREEVVV